MVRISEAEFEVMKVIWQRKECTSVEIIGDLKEFNWKFNTVRTLIKRLQIKGAIEIAGRNGKAYTYRAVIDENEYKKAMTKDLIKKLFHNSINEFVLEYCKESKATSESVKKEIKKLIEQMEEKERKQKEEEENKK